MSDNQQSLAERLVVETHIVKSLEQAEKYGLPIENIFTILQEYHETTQPLSKLLYETRFKLVIASINHHCSVADTLIFNISDNIFKTIKETNIGSGVFLLL